MTYFIKMSLSLVLLFAVYKLLLEKEKMHYFNRFFLLFSMGFSLLVPLMPTLFWLAVFQNQAVPTSEIPIILSTEIELVRAAPTVFSWGNLWMSVYFLVFGLLSFRFVYQLYQMINKIKTNEKIRFKTEKMVLLTEKVLPHTFGNSIFVNKADYLSSKIEPEVLTHEYCHARERHSIDILIVEVLQIIFWFIPIWFLYKKAIQLNHEFLADDYTIQVHQKVPEYQHLLLDKMTTTTIHLASNINFSLTKKRLKMMTKQSSKQRVFWCSIFTAPCFVLLLFLCSCNLDDQPADPVKDAYFKEAIIEYQTTNGKIYKSYSELTDDEKAKIPPPPPSPSGIENNPLPKGTLITLSKNGNIKIDKMGAVPPPPPPPPAPPAPPAVEDAPPPPPPPPAPTPSLLKKMAKNGGTFYKDGQKIEVKEAIDLLENHTGAYRLFIKQCDGAGVVEFKRGE